MPTLLDLLTSLVQMSGAEEPLGAAREPLTGFTGIQRTTSGQPATWMHMGANINGLEWLIPLLNPSLTDAERDGLLGKRPLSDAERRTIEDKSITWAQDEERRNPGTFAKYPSVVEGEAAAGRRWKDAIVRDLPPPPPQYPHYADTKD